MFCLNWLMLVESTILCGKQFQIFIEEGKNEYKYALTVDDGCKNTRLNSFRGNFLRHLECISKVST